MSENQEIHPFRIEVPQAEQDDLADRLAHTRFTEEPTDHDGSYGVPVGYVQQLVARWRDGFDWRAAEARLNAYPQFTTTIDGQRIHFLHVRSENPQALPLILTHSWPGSVVDYLDVIDALTAAGPDAFHLVVPSMPGAGFSGPTTEPGWDRYRTARAWAELMRRLGYPRYGAVGNDAGSLVSPEVGRLDPDHVVGVHVTQIFSFPSGDPAEMAELTEEEQAALGHLQWFFENKGAFNQLQAQQPQTLAHALADSPAGLAGWHGQLLGEDLDPDFVLTNLAISWFTGTIASAMRFYREDALATPPEGPTVAPLGLAQFAGDFQSIRRFADRDHHNVVSWHTYDRGGHYAAHSAPDLYVRDLQEFFRPLR